MSHFFELHVLSVPIYTCCVLRSDFSHTYAKRFSDDPTPQDHSGQRVVSKAHVLSAKAAAATNDQKTDRVSTEFRTNMFLARDAKAKLWTDADTPSDGGERGASALVARFENGAVDLAHQAQESAKPRKSNALAARMAKFEKPSEEVVPQEEEPVESLQDRMDKLRLAGIAGALTAREQRPLP